MNRDLFAAAGGVVEAISVPFNSTTLLLNGDGTNGAQNNTFLDSSTNNFTITRTGTPTQGTFTPFSQTGWGGYFGGSDAVSAPSNAALTLGTNSFTIETWINPATLSYKLITWAGTAGHPDIYFNATGNLVYSNYATSVILTSSIALVLNVWSHVAIVRNSTTTTIYINGVSGGSVSDSNNWGAGVVYINSNGTTPVGQGYLSNLRIVNGTAVYTAAFTPPTAPLTAITNTQLLTLQSNYFKDNSSNNFAITATGTPSIQAFSPFAPTAAYGAATVGGSGYFAGGTDSLATSSTSSAFAFGTGDFTVECWVYITADSSVVRGIWQNGTADSCNIQRNTSGNLQAWDGTDRISTTTVLSNAWNHIAFCRASGTARIFVNGVVAFSWTSSVNYTTASVWVFGYTAGGTNRMVGNISNARIVTGTALYTTAFTPPTAPLTTSIAPFVAPTTVEYLVVAGGGGGGSGGNMGAGGGAGGYLTSASFSMPAYPITITVGAGGAGATNGSNSVFSSLTAIGGGGGAAGNGVTGGSGGSGAGSSFSAANGGVVGAGTSGQGYSGGIGADGVAAYTSGGGGGGAGGVGAGTNTPVGGSGGVGLSSSITGTAVYRAGGGGGGTNYVGYAAGSGGTGGGGAGISGGAGTGVSGTVNTGGGGGGGTAGGAGGSGVVILAYPTSYQGLVVSSGLTYTVNATARAGYQVYTFTAGTGSITGSSTSLLLSGTNAGVYDATAKNDIITTGTARISTAQSKFGGSSIALLNTSSANYLTVPASVNRLLTGDFTVEMWANCPSGSSQSAYANIIKGAASPNNAICASFASSLKYMVFCGTPAVSISSTVTSNDGVWHHLAFVRSGTTCKFYVDGTAAATTVTTSAAFDFGSAGALTIGGGLAGDNWTNCYIDDLRITKGVARYTANFTPPTTAMLGQ